MRAPDLARLLTLAQALAPERARLVATAAGAGANTDDALVTIIGDALVAGGAPETWLALSVLRAELPTRDLVIATRRRLRFGNPADLVRELVTHPVRRGTFGRGAPRAVRIVTGAVFVDVHHTARTGLATGIQRVVRKTIERWEATHPIVLVGWGATYGGMRELSAPERENALHGSNPHAKKPRTGEVTIPWKSTYVLPELAIEPERVSRIAALAEFSGNRTGVVGYDCVPLTSADTIGAGMGAAFAKNLSAVARVDKVAAISIAAKLEYTGWRRMLAGAGMSGPDVREVVLAREASSVTDEELEDARRILVSEDLPLVLCVGSHEPRKNHLAVLQAAEQLWIAGRQFSVVFIGGNSWGSHDFDQQLERLRADGRPVTTIASVTDVMLWSAYRLAAVTVFPSLNEGYGLPVAEALAAGCPVVTSNFGSMQEIASEGGALLVNPRDDDGIAVAIDQVVFDPAVNQRLRDETSGITPRDWAEYAGELWGYLVEGDAQSAPVSGPD
jgi:glycosyltransferase involved in cell wall biosynthesis